MIPLSGRRLTLLTAALLAIGIGAAYSNSLSVGFEFDDVYLLTNNPSIRSLRNIPRFFYDPFTLTTVRENADLRPVLQITYALNHAISGLRPWSYHAVNMVLHLVAALLVFRIVRDHLWPGPALVPAAAALFFALAPLNSQTLDYMSARSALLCTTLYLAAFWCVLRRRQWPAALLHALALLTKAIAVTLPAVIVAYDFLYRDRARCPTVLGYVRDWRRVVRLVLAPVVLDLAYLLYRRLLLPPWVSETFHQSFTTPWLWFMSEWSAQLYYVRLFLWPDALSIDHDFPYAFSFFQARAWLALCVIVAWIAVALRSAARRPLVAFATLWFFITLAPESSFAPLAEVINDHRPYIASSLGLSVLLAWLIHEASSRLRERQQPAFVLACLVLCAVTIPITRHRNWQWQDSVRLWTDAAEKGPGNGRAWMNAGLALMDRGQLAEARRHFERARASNPGYAYVYMNISVLEAREGHLDAALHAADEAVRLNPGLAPAHYYRGRVLEKLGRTEEAAAAYGQALAIDPRHLEASNAVARLTPNGASSAEALMQSGLDALYAQRKPEEAAAYFRKVLDRNPTHYGATYQLAKALDASGHGDEAQRLWATVLQMAEGYGDQTTAATARARLQAKR